jgi:hypothetical protein
LASNYNGVAVEVIKVGYQLPPLKKKYGEDIEVVLLPNNKD